MIPETLAGLIVLAAGAGPGYLFVQLAERYGPRRDRSVLEETAELLVVGSIATGGAFLFVLWVGGWLCADLDSSKLGADPRSYVFQHPGQLLLIIASTLALSYAAVWLVVTQIAYRGQEREVQPGGSMWYAAFKRLLPQDHGTFVTVERQDGSVLTGLLGSATADDSTPREVLIIAPKNRPIYARAARDAEVAALQDSFVVVRAEDIVTLSGQYLPVEDDAHRAGERRWPCGVRRA